jgi:hypothetical protein
MRAALLAEPHWTQAARALISGCVDLRHDDDLAALLEAVCRGLGDELYPAFLRVLAEVGRQGRTRRPRRRGARTGARLAHGAPAQRAARRLGCVRPVAAHAHAAWARWSTSAPGPARVAVPTATPCPAADFESAAQAVMTVVSASDSARLLYCEKLLADAAGFAGRRLVTQHQAGDGRDGASLGRRRDAGRSRRAFCHGAAASGGDAGFDGAGALGPGAALSAARKPPPASSAEHVEQAAIRIFRIWADESAPSGCAAAKLAPCCALPRILMWNNGSVEALSWPDAGQCLACDEFSLRPLRASR